MRLVPPPLSPPLFFPPSSTPPSSPPPYDPPSPPSPSPVHDPIPPLPQVPPKEAPIAMQPVKDDAVFDKLSLGEMNLECPKCHALHWKAKIMARSSLTNLKFGACGKSGKVELLFL